MSWSALLLLAGLAYLMKAAAPVALGPREVPPRIAALLGLVAVPLLAALILVQTFDGGERLTVDARVPALGVASVLVWRRAPFLVVVIASAATAAGLRALG